MWYKDFIKISYLNTFRHYQTQDNTWEYDKESKKWNKVPWTLEQLVKKLVAKPSLGYHWYAGQSVHKAIQTKGFLTYPQDTYMFLDTWNLRKKIDTSRIVLPVEDCEGWIKPIVIAGHIIKGRYDTKKDTCIHDIKTSASFNKDDYLADWQWRFYMLGEDAEDFIYHLFAIQFDEKKPKERDANGMKRLNSQNLDVVDYDTIVIERPTDLLEQCTKGVLSWIEFLKENKVAIRKIAKEKFGVELADDPVPEYKTTTGIPFEEKSDAYNNMMKEFTNE